MILQSVTRGSPRSSAAARRGPPNRTFADGNHVSSKPSKVEKSRGDGSAEASTPITVVIPKGFPADIMKALINGNHTSTFLYAVSLIDVVRSQLQERRMIGKLRSIFESLLRDEDFATHAAEATLDLYEANAGNSGFPASTMLLRALEVCASHCAEKAVWQRLQGDMMGKTPDLETVLLELLDN